MVLTPVVSCFNNHNPFVTPRIRSVEMGKMASKEGEVKYPNPGCQSISGLPILKKSKDRDSGECKQAHAQCTVGSFGFEKHTRKLKREFVLATIEPCIGDVVVEAEQGR